MWRCDWRQLQGELEFYGDEGREGSSFGVVCMYVGIEVKYLNTRTFGLDMRAHKVDDIIEWGIEAH